MKRSALLPLPDPAPPPSTGSGLSETLAQIMQTQAEMLEKLQVILDSPFFRKRVTVSDQREADEWAKNVLRKIEMKRRRNP